MKHQDKQTLQSMINLVVETNNKFQIAQSRLHDWTKHHYGIEAGDIDANQILDAVFGNCGKSCGMTAEEYDKEMIEGTNRHERR